jgi:hypothetical protein
MCIRDRHTKHLKSLAIAYFSWMALGLISGIVTNEGTIPERLSQDRIFSLWLASFYILFLSLPGLAGVTAVLSGSKTALGISLSALMTLAVIAMVHSEASRNLLLDQSVPLSVMTVAGMIVYVEVLSLLRRLEEYREGTLNPSIVRRNLFFLGFFLAVSLSLASFPFLIDLGPLGIYDLGTIHGKAMMGLLILVPILLFGILRKRR